MKRLAVAAVAILAITGAAVAQPAPKVFVCKYVGKPGVDERLQTGNNPINVSSNSIKDYAGVGSFFNDAQGRSYVLAVDNGQPDPNVSECPQPQGPPTTPPVVTTPPATSTTPAPKPLVNTPAEEPIVGKGLVN